MILINGVEVRPTIFPDKTSQVWKLDEKLFTTWDCTIEWRFENESEFLHLAQLRDLSVENFRQVNLRLPYLPYGRQDKQISNQETFALRTFCKLLNYLEFDSVTCFDPHSSVALELINNFHATYPVSQVQRIYENLSIDVICYPDKGATVKYTDLIKLPFVCGNKTREQSTGKIIDYTLNGHVERKKILIVDDICDGGATFIILCEALKKRGAKEVNLFVSHGIFSKGTQVLRDAGINKIFTKEGEIK